MGVSETIRRKGTTFDLRALVALGISPEALIALWRIVLAWPKPPRSDSYEPAFGRIVKVRPHVPEFLGQCILREGSLWASFCQKPLDVDAGKLGELDRVLNRRVAGWLVPLGHRALGHPQLFGDPRLSGRQLGIHESLFQARPEGFCCRFRHAGSLPRPMNG